MRQIQWKNKTRISSSSSPWGNQKHLLGALDPFSSFQVLAWGLMGSNLKLMKILSNWDALLFSLSVTYLMNSTQPNFEKKLETPVLHNLQQLKKNPSKSWSDRRLCVRLYDVDYNIWSTSILYQAPCCHRAFIKTSSRLQCSMNCIILSAPRSLPARCMLLHVVFIWWW